MSFVNAMEGAALAAERKYDLAIAQAWHTAIFALNGYGGKLKGKSLADFIGKRKDSRANNHALQRARGIAFFRRLQVQGVPVKITRVERSDG